MMTRMVKAIRFRRAEEADLPAIVRIYDKILEDQEMGRASIGWARGIYPTEKTARDALKSNSLYVEELGGKVCGSAIINQCQVDVYKKVSWSYPASEDQVLVLHTLTIDPEEGRKGLGEKFVGFYERLAKEKACPYLRLDTNAINERAQAMYQKLGYQIVGRELTVFNGIDRVELLMLEKTLY